MLQKLILMITHSFVGTCWFICQDTSNKRHWSDRSYFKTSCHLFDIFLLPLKR